MSTNVDIINEWVWSSRRRAKHFSRKRSPKAILHIFVKVAIVVFLLFVLGIACWVTLLTPVRDFCVFPSLFEEESSLQVQYLKLVALRDLVHFLRTFQVLPKVKVFQSSQVI